MKQYKYIGYYNDNADIKDIIASKGWNDPDEIAAYYEGGYGNFHSSDSDEEDCMTISDVDKKNIFLSMNGRYIVKFSEGHAVALDEDDTTSINAGYFVDIWKVEEEKETFDPSDEALKEISDKRRKEDLAIKCAIKDEFKARFKNPGEGLDLYSNASKYVYGMLDATGCIGRMFLNEDGEIQVLLVQEYEDLVEDFESRYFACDDWPTLLLLVREGIKEDWLIEPEYVEE